MKTISSRQNPLFRRVRDAIRDPADEIVVEGPKQVRDALSAGWEPIMVIVRAERSDWPADASLRTTMLSNELFDALAETRTSQGVLGLFQRPKAALPEILDTSAVIVALDAVQDPGNLGTIIRLAAAFDASGVVLLPGCADPFSPKAIRASSSAILGVPVVTATADDLIATNLPIYAADTGGDAIDPPSANAILVFGSEGSGLSAPIRSVARLVSIPMSARTESLNVAASAAILLARVYALRSRG